MAVDEGKNIAYCPSNTTRIELEEKKVERRNRWTKCEEPWRTRATSLLSRKTQRNGERRCTRPWKRGNDKTKTAEGKKTQYFLL